MDTRGSGTCAFCDRELVEGTRSKEHIIPNAIGGRLKTSGFICQSCNSKGGDAWDAKLAEQLNWFTLSLGISRERGYPPSQLVTTVDGRQLNLLADGSFSPRSSYSESVIDGGKKIHIVARSMEEARKRLVGVAKKHPSFELEKELSNLKLETTYLDSPLTLELSFGGGDAGRSLVKTALAFASYCGVSHELFGNSLAYLLGANVEPSYGHAFLSDLVVDRDPKAIFHCVALKGDPEKQRLWSYIEYYGMCRVVVSICDSYQGPHIDEVYALDPISGEELTVVIDGEISDQDFDAIVQGRGGLHERQLEAANIVLPVVIERSQHRALERSVSEGFAYAAHVLGIAEGEEIPLDKAREFTDLMMQKITPFIESLIRR
ncbi:hypothetical protein B8W72_26135 [Pseudomonas putida]|uniref:HNH endonuclease 5 domain-containing protein n=1 Tax=Pseudomonas putida TaxID=303 RepID=A0A1Y3KK94_PSEPU|nr:HNH endonuclease [Pseudomonas putida]OUM24651.1 hypothetical protein B8W72_26135 [Pseudomonas putida]